MISISSMSMTALAFGNSDAFFHEDDETVPESRKSMKLIRADLCFCNDAIGWIISYENVCRQYQSCISCLRLTSCKL